MSKVFVMGIDGGSFDLIRKWKNDLPNFSKLIDQGTSGYLHTIVPMLTPPAWTSFFTGKNPHWFKTGTTNANSHHAIAQRSGVRINYNYSQLF